MAYKMSDRDAMDAIHAIMDKVEWSADTLDLIAEVVGYTDREIHSPEATA